MKSMKLYFFECTTNKFTLPYLVCLAEIKYECSVFSLKDIDRLSVKKDDVFVFSFLTTDAFYVHQAVKKIRERKLSNIIIAGGAHVDGNPVFSLTTIGFDYAITGYASAGCFDFIFSSITNEPSKKIIDLPEVDSIDDLLPLSGIVGFRPPLEIRRGCDRNCTFCRTSKNRKLITRSYDSVNNYLRILKKENLKRVSFVTPSAFQTGDKEFVEKILQTSSTHFKFVEYGIFPSEADPCSINPSWLGIINKYCSNKKITIGCQSGSAFRLRELKRAHTLEDVTKACAYVKEAGLRPVVDFIVGFPRETDDELQQTRNYIFKLHREFSAFIQVHYFIPLPGTELEHERSATLSGNTIDWLNKTEKAGIIKGAWKLHYYEMEKIAPYIDWWQTEHVSGSSKVCCDKK